MCTYIKNYSARCYIVQTTNVKFCMVVQRRLIMNKFVRRKSPTGSIFSKIFFEQLYREWTVVVHLYCSFSLWCQMAPQQSAKFRTMFLVNFVPVWGRIASPIMFDLDTVFDICCGSRCALQHTKHFADPSVGGATRFAKLWSKFCKA